ncbi:hypothetical protein [Lysobacter enzymogenes]|uniref:hypothetical protein n=1 Tax=Lysobacter enzymogenes TaxID=69 RepID=UPI00099E0EBA|nr:hypothetical protein [Lysobacter enzymogenes]UZW60571.1 hypothetical protein BV903_025545 [Lysobacter enzymogenes]
MRALSPLALGLLIATAPALAAAQQTNVSPAKSSSPQPVFSGSDFCDSCGTPPLYTEGAGAPGGGAAPAQALDPGEVSASSCEVSMVVSPQVPGSTAPGYARIRDLPYTAAIRAALQAADEWPLLPLLLQRIDLPTPGIGAARAPAAAAVIDLPAASEATFLEWSFAAAPDAPKQSPAGARVLVLTVSVDRRGAFLRADWLATPGADWSYYTAPNAPPAATPGVLASRVAKLYDAGRFSAQRLTLLHDGAWVRVGVGEPVREWLSFELPDAQWQPARLRNGLLRGTALGDGQGLQMQWPTLSHSVLNPAPSTPPPTQSAASAGR